MIKLDYIPDSWTKDQMKIYEIYLEYFADNRDGVDLQAVEELEKMLARWLEESQTKIVSWNCNGKFREKFKEILEEDADIYVIQECENPAESIDEDYREFAGDNYIWTGHLHYKGLGIFAKEDIELEKIEYDGVFEHFILVRVNDSFNLLGVWAMPKYVEMIHDFFDANEELFCENMVMCGDFNSSVVFNYHHPKAKNHTELNRKLESKNLFSVYHDLTGDKQGSEKSMTFYQARHLNNPFHMDYVYAGENLVKEFEILDHYKWITVSDHLPLVFKI
ncbi:MAG: endonuclease/exonuclease/phosphatase family protein [Methanobrevibacter sp.]|nr:endonuclease/exonuclease/phosphatase family protein [Methanobrevibacter sp.]